MGASLVNSFDVFDTAITRRVAHPDHLHWLVGRRLRRMGLIACPDDAFRSLRIRAEAACRARGPEPDLGEIYRALQGLLAWRPETARQAMAVELEEEARSVVPVASIKRLHDAARGRRMRPIFISDTYLKNRDVLGLLRHCGYVVDQADVHASCDHRRSKAAGTLFATVVESTARPAREFSHIGDNRRSDWRNARRAGLEATWIRHTALNPYEAAMWRASRGDLEGSLVAGAARAARLSADPDGSSALWGVGTSVAGPLLTSFVLWTLITAERRGLKRLYFLARDGQAMFELARRLSRWAGLDIDCRYMLASRQAFFMASLPSDPALALASALSQNGGNTVEAALRGLEFTDARIVEILRVAGFARGRILAGSGEESRRLTEAVAGLGLLADLGEAIAFRTKALLSYLEAEDFLDAEPRAIVDLGWHGNLQLRLDRCIAKVGGRPADGFYYGLCACPPSIAARVQTYARDKLYNPHLLEVFCLADHASIRGFALDEAGRGVGLGILEPDDEALAWGVRRQQAGIVSFCAHLVDGLDPTLVEPAALLAALRPAAEAALQLFTRRPSPEEAQAYGRVLHSSDQAHLDKLELAPVLRGIDFLHALLDWRMRRRISKWAGGTIARSTRPAIGHALSEAIAIQWRVVLAARLLARALHVGAGAGA